MNQTFTTTRRVEFCETDAAGIAHFSSFFPYMEQAEHELFRHLGTSVVTRDEQSVVSWPRVTASCDYQGAVRFEDVLTVRLWIERLGEKSVTYGIEFAHDQRIVATGKMTTVCCRIQPDEFPIPIPIPKSLAEKLSAFTKSATSRE
jgi:4-hydroxybenzoyl-CoA thioesterase/acyl-CoA thioester hydrolase